MTTRHRTCAECGNQFSYLISRGADRKYCSPGCGNKANERLKEAKAANYKDCSAPGCNLKANRVGAGLCEKHYIRLRRNGELSKKDVVKTGSLTHTGGYLLDYDPDHRLSRGHSRVYQHRKVFHTAHGEGPFSCHWCGVCVTWDDMHVDHVNAVVTDNRLSNLVASCPQCNMQRGNKKMKRTHQERGIMIDFNGERLHISEWAKRLGISRAAMRSRLDSWPLEDALTRPKGAFGPKPTSPKQYR